MVGTYHLPPPGFAADGERLTDLKCLQDHVLSLARIDEATVPFLSCYLNLEDPSRDYLAVLEDRMDALLTTVSGRTRAALEDALPLVRYYLRNEILPQARGVALFSRGYCNSGRYFLPLQFAVPVPDSVGVYPVPNIYHLVELKDNYDRYILVLVTEGSTRIMDVALGAVTRQVWLQNPALHYHSSSGWTRTHYWARHRDRPTEPSIEAIAEIMRLMESGGSAHLILAGHPDRMAAVRLALPKSVIEQVVDAVVANEHQQIDDVVQATLAIFREHEDEESRSVAAQLVEQVRADGLAVVGIRSCHEALREGLADTLVVSSTFSKVRGTECSFCHTFFGDDQPDRYCPECGESSLRPVTPAAEIVREAVKQGCPVEVMEHSDTLDAMGGIGCLLRARRRS